jgi:hypothetical protein
MICAADGMVVPFGEAAVALAGDKHIARKPSSMKAIAASLRAFADERPANCKIEMCLT